MTERSNTMAIRLYESDSGIKEFTATVRKCEPRGEGYGVALDRTAFFPTGGGQTCDTGYIGTARVSDVSLVDGDALHTVSEPLEVGAEYRCVLDYAERLEKMRSHTAEHILSSYIYKSFGFKNVGFHLGSADTTCDFDGWLSRDMLTEAEAYVNRVVMEDHPVYAEFPSAEALKELPYRSKLDLEGDVRIVFIGKDGEIDLCACCAPHVKATGQIGYFKIVDAYAYKGGMRIHILTGTSAVSRGASEHYGIRTVSELLSAKPYSNDVIAAVERLLNENNALRAALEDSKGAVAEAVTANVREGEPFLYLTDSSDADLLRKIALKAKEKGSSSCTVVGGGDGSYRFVLCGDDAQTLLAKIKALGGKGGGRDVICGSVSCTEDAIAELMK